MFFKFIFLVTIFNSVLLAICHLVNLVDKPKPMYSIGKINYMNINGFIAIIGIIGFVILIIGFIFALICNNEHSLVTFDNYIGIIYIIAYTVLVTVKHFRSGIDLGVWITILSLLVLSSIARFYPLIESRFIPTWFLIGIICVSLFICSLKVVEISKNSNGTL